MKKRMKELKNRFFLKLTYLKNLQLNNTTLK
nr:MAG TPA: hypothetical protein [Caudoviricetes sp.]